MKNEHKIPGNTSYGPQETEEISKLLRNKKALEINMTKNALEEQIKDKSMFLQY
jgi:hypothetical protein